MNWLNMTEVWRSKDRIIAVEKTAVRRRRRVEGECEGEGEGEEETDMRALEGIEDCRE